MGPAAKRRKLNQSAVEEVVFDPSARSDYLTGFHKRKVQRIKAAQEAAAQRARQEKIDDRRKVRFEAPLSARPNLWQLREERKADLERHVREVNALLPATTANATETRSSDGEEDDSGSEPVGSLPSAVDRKSEYIDEDKYTTVIVEEVDVSRHGLSSLADSESNPDGVTGEIADPAIKKSPTASQGKPPTKVKDTKVKKKKKKAFRYESPADRKVNRMKEQARKSKAARARRGD